MFAVMSWIQDSGIDGGILQGPNKGVAALLTGALLYHFLAKKAITKKWYFNGLSQDLYLHHASEEII